MTEPPPRLGTRPRRGGYLVSEAILHACTKTQVGEDGLLAFCRLWASENTTREHVQYQLRMLTRFGKLVRVDTPAGPRYMVPIEHPESH